MNLRFVVKSNRFPQAPALLRKAVGAAFASQREPVLGEVRRRTPVDTGELRDSESAESTDTTLTIRATAPHAIYVHQGARGRPARRFMAEGVEASLPGIEQAIVDAANRELA